MGDPRTFLLALSLVTVSALSARALSGGRRRAMKADARAERLREAEAFRASCQVKQPKEPKQQQTPGQSISKKQPKSSETLAAPWMLPIKKALNHGGTQRSKRDRSEAKRKQLQLASVDPSSGCPSVRTVVFRGFLPIDLSVIGGSESCVLTFITDTRSEKVRHIREAEVNAPVELCWWLDDANVQFRISGHAVLATATSEDASLRAACEAVWDRLGSSTRRTFTWPNPGEPSAPATAEPPPHAAAAAEEAGDTAGEIAGEIALADANFCVLLVVPHRVDELRLGGKQRRTLYTLERDERGGAAGGALAPLGTSWQVQDVNP